MPAHLAAGPQEPVDPEFARELGSYLRNARRGIRCNTVQPGYILHEERDAVLEATNGGEATGILSSPGTSYSVDVYNEDGSFQSSIAGWRVSAVRLDPIAIPEDKYSWRPAPGVRSASRLLAALPSHSS